MPPCIRVSVECSAFGAVMRAKFRLIYCESGKARPWQGRAVLQCRQNSKHVYIDYSCGPTADRGRRHHCTKGPCMTCN